ncbi:amidohydrolase family protein [Microbacterium sp. NPDC076911]|uniref:amidohydrolase family protein n=1 Tax=Microbacterium sp. NPDC076911 TaxID=3154958 RepID=UPI00342FF01E
MSATEVPREEAVVRAAWVLTAGPDGAVRNGAIHIADGQILAVGEFDSIAARASGVPVVGDGTGILAPGWVNTHTHLSEALATGMGSELTLFEWGEKIVGPLGDVVTAQDAAEGTALKAVELLLSGVTTVNDMFVHSNPGSYASVGVVEGLERSGLRGIVSFGAEDMANPDAGPWGTVEEILDEHAALRAAADSSDLVTFRYGIGTLLGQSDELLSAGAAACEEHGWGIHTHLAETREELVVAAGRWGRRTIDHAEHLGLLHRPLIAGHAVWATRRDIDLLASRGVAVAHNPVANMILGSGVCPVPDLRAAGIAVGIGTDGAASNDSQDMLQAVKSAALLQKVHALDPSVIDAQTVFEMGTIEGARALGIDDVVGSLVAGKRADVVLYQDTVDVAIVHDPYGQLVYGASPRSVSAVWVDGRRLVDDHVCVTVSERDQIVRSRPLAQRIARDSSLSSAGWSVL